MGARLSPNLGCRMTLEGDEARVFGTRCHGVHHQVEASIVGALEPAPMSMMRSHGTGDVG